MHPALSRPQCPPPDDLVIGGRYRVVRRLGRGGMGDVFEAENLWTKRRVALKTMRPEHADNDELTRRFQREAQAASQLSHPHVVDVLDMGEDAATGALFIVQELLVGHDLRAHLDAAGRQPLRDVLAWALPVMDALAAAHALGVVHRDLKPDNIFLAETPRGAVPKLIDFGIARHHDADGVGRTRTGLLLGTPAYMAPEQAVGDTNLDARADVWALGVVVYEALSGQRPHAAATTGAMLAKVIYEDPRPLDAVAPDLPADLVTAVMGALHRDPALRYPTMRAFEEALRACAAAGDADAPALVPATVVTPRPIPSIVGTFIPRVETVGPCAPRPSARRHAAAAVLGVLSCALIVASVALTRTPRPALSARPAAARPAAPAPVPTLVLPATPVVPSSIVIAAPPPTPVATTATARSTTPATTTRTRRRAGTLPAVALVPVAPAIVRSSPFDPID